MTKFLGTGGHKSRNPVKDIERYVEMRRIGKRTDVIPSTDGPDKPYMVLGGKLIVCAN